MCSRPFRTGSWVSSSWWRSSRRGRQLLYIDAGQGCRRVSPNNRSFAPLLLYVGAFHVLWIAWPFVVYPKLLGVGNTTLAYAALNLTFRFFYWIAPVILYLRYVDGVDPLAYLKLTQNVRRGVVVAIVLT